MLVRERCFVPLEGVWKVVCKRLFLLRCYRNKDGVSVEDDPGREKILLLYEDSAAYCLGLVAYAESLNQRVSWCVN
jgi:hypothetical protein